MSYKRFLILCIMTGGLLTAPFQTAQAEGLTLTAMGTETGSYASNPLMVTRGAKPLMGSTTSPELIIKDTTQSSLLILDTRLDENLFDQTSFNSTDIHATANASGQGQLWSAALQQRTDYDTTRTSELTNYGITPVVTRHTGLSAAPQISYTPSARDTVSLAGTLTTSQYDNNVFTNYETFAATPTYTHNFDQRNAAQLILQAQRYQTTKGPSIRVDSAGPSIGSKTTLSPRFTANATVGAQTSRQYLSGIAASPWAWQYVFTANSSFKGEQNTINMDASRSQSPYGNGTEALQTKFALTESHALNPYITLNIGASYLTSTYQVAAVGNLKSLTSGNLGVAYHATNVLDITTSYQYRNESLTNVSKVAQDHSLMLNLVYHPKDWTL